MVKITYEEMMEKLRIQKYKDISSYDKVIDLGVQSMWNELSSKIDDSSIDPTDIFDEEIEYLKNLSYSMKLMNICCISETWEQDLYKFLKERGLIEVASNDYNTTKKVFNKNYPTCAISSFPLIEEMRALVNAIKHGEGNSFNNIRRLTSDTILADSNIGIEDENGKIIRKKEIEFDPNTLTSRTLNVDGKLKLYSDTLVEFWEKVYKADKDRRNNINISR